MNNFCSFQRLIMQLNAANEKCYTMKDNVELKEQIENIANDNTKAEQCFAQALLKEVFSYQYPTLTLLPNENGSSSAKMLHEEDVTNDEVKRANDNFTIYPNPTSLNLIFNTDKDVKAKIIIKDMIGRKIDEFEINSNSINVYSALKLKANIYFVSLYIDEQIYEEQKIIIME
jgi:hypothetical protein